jgi:hypothetical protein
MNLPDRTAVTGNSRSSGLPSLAALLALLACTVAAKAQDVVATRPVDDVVPSALQQAQAAQGVIPSAAVPAFAPDTPVIESGPLTVRAHFFYSYLYGDGIPSRDGQRQTTAIQNVAPDFLIDLGTHWTIDYTPTWVFYSSSAFKDSVDQSVRMTGWATAEDWIMQFSQSYSTTSSPLIETGAQTKQVYWSTNLSGTYSFNSKMALELTALHSYQSAESFTTSQEWSTMDWLHYKFAPQLDTSVGLGYGYVGVSKGTDMTYTRPQVQVTWTATRKITFTIHGGEESRHFLSGGTPNLNSPIYGASVLYQPFETTKLTLGTEHQVTASFLEDEITKGTQWTGQLEQRLLKEFYLSVALSRGKVDYLPLAGSTVGPRNDLNYSLNVRLSTTLFRRCTVAAIYQDSHNSSTEAGFGLSSSQVGFEIGYRY